MLACLLWLMLAPQQRLVMRISVTVPVDPPGRVCAFVVSGQPGKAGPTVYLSWKPSPDLAQSGSAKFGTGYDVYRQAGSASPVKLNSGLVAAHAYADSSAVKGKKYSYWVTALVGKVESKPSNTITFRP